MSDDPRRFIDDAIAYADKLAMQPAAASFHARFAAQRFLSDLEEARHDSRWEFKPELATRAMLFATHCATSRGPRRGGRRLMDWQQFVYANLFGFV